MSLLWHWPGCTIWGGDVRIIVGALWAGEGCSVGCSSGAGPARILSIRVIPAAALTADESSHCSSYDAFSAGVWLGSKWFDWFDGAGVSVIRWSRIAWKSLIEDFAWFTIWSSKWFEWFDGAGVSWWSRLDFVGVIIVILVVLSSFFTSILTERRRFVLAVQDIN